jgi:periplasmic protein TonB
MSGPNQLRGHEALPATGDTAELGRIVPARERADPPFSRLGASNVVPFVRPRAEQPPPAPRAAIVVDAGDRPAPETRRPDARLGIVALFALSLVVHIGLYLLLNREPEPMASVGLEAISVELVLGANSPAGPAAPAEQETRPVSADTPAEPEKTEAADQAPPERPVETTPEPEQTPTPAAIAPPEPEPQPSPLAAAPPETPAAPAEPPKPEVQPEPAKPEVKPEPPKPEVKPPSPKPEVKPQPVRQREARPKPATKRDAGPGTRAPNAAKRAATPGPRANAASGAGAGRSSNDANYRGLVSAHLARYKRFPAEAQGSGAQGSATVTFALDGGGRVTRAALVRGTGVPALDGEAVAMVHRASPFPAPPDHRPVSFTVPVSYRMR